MDSQVVNPLDHQPFPSRRSPVLASGAMVATSQPLAAQAGLATLADGGTAVDAAIAAAAVLTVVEPCSNGLGSDAFALVWDGGRLHGLNGSGRWPSGADPDALRAEGHTTVPSLGWVPVTVPGAVDAWSSLHERFGRLPVERVLRPAVEYAEAGHPVSPVVARHWAASEGHFTSAARHLPELEGWATVFAPEGRTPRAGEVWASPGHARGLRCLARNGLRDFYEGEVAAAMIDWSQRTGGPLVAEDLAGHRSQWVEPISVDYRGHQVWELPPNGQGLAALLALGVLDRVDLGGRPAMGPDAWHLQIEAMKLAFSDSDAWVADPDWAEAPIGPLLDPGYLDRRAALIGESAGPAPRGNPDRGGTVYLCAADRDGMMVSFIQSNYMGFGSGVVVASHGIALQNRAVGFVLDPDHPNAASPGKRPRHTIIPGFVSRDGRPLGPFGVMGGEMQPQGHLQVVSGLIDRGLNPQAALDAPRWMVERDGRVLVEESTPRAVVEGLRARGHAVRVEPNSAVFGRGQVIVRSGSAYVAGSEPRADGAAVGF